MKKYRTNTGYTLAPTSSPTLDGCDFDIDVYLSQCYCTNTSPEMGSPFNRFIKHENNEYKYRDNNYVYDNKKIPEYNHNPIPNSPIYYPELNPSNGDNVVMMFLSIMVASIMLHFVVLCYIFYIFGCTPIKREENKIRYSKVINYDPEQNVIKA